MLIIPYYDPILTWLHVDAKHHIYRAPPGSTLINSKNTHTPVHARSSKFPIPKPILASHLQSVSSTPSNANGQGSSPTSSSNANILAKVDIHPNKLVMPTKENIELMEKVFAAGTQWVELQKQLERVDAEVNAHKARLGIANTGSGAGAGASASSTAAGTKVEGDASGSASTARSDTAETKARRSSSVSTLSHLFIHQISSISRLILFISHTSEFLNNETLLLQRKRTLSASSSEEGESGSNKRMKT